MASRAAGVAFSPLEGILGLQGPLPSDSRWDSHFSLSALLDSFLDTSSSFASWALCGHQPGPRQGCTHDHLLGQ